MSACCGNVHDWAKCRLNEKIKDLHRSACLLGIIFAFPILSVSKIIQYLIKILISRYALGILFPQQHKATDKKDPF